jgi:enoyl-CoA hydratase
MAFLKYQYINYWPHNLIMSPMLAVECYYSGLRHYVERIGRLCLTADEIDTATMLRIGFLNEVSPIGEFEARLEAMNSICHGTADPSAIDASLASLRSPGLGEGLIMKAWSERRLARFADA